MSGAEEVIYLSENLDKKKAPFGAFFILGYSASE